MPFISGGGGGGVVASVTAADTSVVVGGTAAAPTVRTGTLDVIAADHAPAADWSNNSHKITALANGSAASDAAAFGQVGMVQLFNSTLLSDAATIDTGAGGIAGGFSHLRVVCSIRSARAANTSDALRFRFNNDGGANYNNTIMFTIGSGSPLDSGSQEFGAVGIYAECPAASAPANEYGLVVIDVAAYTSTAHIFFYSYTYQYAKAFTAGNQTTAWAGGAYNVTGSAISRLSVVSTNSANILAGSQMTVYGLL